MKILKITISAIIIALLINLTLWTIGSYNAFMLSVGHDQGWSDGYDQCIVDYQNSSHVDYEAEELRFNLKNY